jgi:hypothetical protein
MLTKLLLYEWRKYWYIIIVQFNKNKNIIFNHKFKISLNRLTLPFQRKSLQILNVLFVIIFNVCEHIFSVIFLTKCIHSSWYQTPIRQKFKIIKKDKPMNKLISMLIASNKKVCKPTNMTIIKCLKYTCLWIFDVNQNHELDLQ